MIIIINGTQFNTQLDSFSFLLIASQPFCGTEADPEIGWQHCMSPVAPHEVWKKAAQSILQVSISGWMSQ